MNIKSMLSTESLRKQLNSIVTKFPIPALVLTIFSGLLIANVIHEFISYVEALAWSGVFSFFATLAIATWCQLLKKEKWSLPLQCLTLALAITDYIFITINHDFGAMGLIYTRIASITAVVIGLFFPPYGYKLSTRWLFSFTINQLWATIYAGILGFVLSMSVISLESTLKILFNFWNDKFFINSIIITGLWIPGLYYLTRVSNTSKISANTPPKGIISYGSLYVLLPLWIIYLVIIYVYGFNILFKMELPKDSLTSIVSGLISNGLITMYGLQGLTLYARDDRPSKFAVIARQWMPALMLPPLALMTVGLIYRLGQYGVTISRLYVAIFVVWAAVILIYLMVKKLSARLNNIAASFALVFVLVTVIPYANITDIALRCIRTSAIEMLGKDRHYPITIEQVREIYQTMPDEKAERTHSLLVYLFDNSPKGFFKDVVSVENSKNKYSIHNLLNPQSDSKKDSGYLALEYDGSVNIPEGYNHFNTVGGSLREKNAETIGIDFRDQVITAPMNIDSIKALRNDHNFRPIVVTVDTKDGQAVLTIVRITHSYNTYTDTHGIYASGYLFTK